MDTRSLGGQGLVVSAEGLGCMGMSEFYGDADEAEAIATIHRALDLGVKFLDTADMYGPFTNERLVGRAIARPARAGRAGHQVRQRAPRGRQLGRHQRPARVRARAACDASLERLGVDVHRPLLPAPRGPDACPSRRRSARWRSWCAAGKVRYLGLSEAAPETIRRAHAVHPISALQTEYSLWTRDPEARILPTVPRAGHRLRGLQPAGPRVPHRPVPHAPRTCAEGDFRSRHPRFQGENFEHNRRIVERVEAIAAEQGRDRRAARPGVGARPGRRHRAHPRDQAGGHLERERGRRGRSSSSGGGPRGGSTRRRPRR